MVLHAQNSACRPTMYLHNHDLSSDMKRGAGQERDGGDSICQEKERKREDMYNVYICKRKLYSSVNISNGITEHTI